MPPIKDNDEISKEEKNNHPKTITPLFLLDTPTDSNILTAKDNIPSRVLDRQEEQAKLEDKKNTRKKRDSIISDLAKERKRRRRIFDQIKKIKRVKNEKQRLNTYPSQSNTAIQDHNIATPFNYESLSVQENSRLLKQPLKKKDKWHKETFEENNGIITAKIEFPNQPDVILTFPKSYFDTFSKSGLDATSYNKTNTVNLFKSPGSGNHKNHELKDVLTTNLLPEEIDRNNHKNTLNSNIETETNPFPAQLSDTSKADTQPVTDKIDKNSVKTPETSFENFKLQECIRNGNPESQAYPCIFLLINQKDLFKYINENIKIKNHQTVTNLTEERTNLDLTTPLVKNNAIEPSRIASVHEDIKSNTSDTEINNREISQVLDEVNSTKSDDIITSTNTPINKNVGQGRDPGSFILPSMGKSIGKAASEGLESFVDSSSSVKKLSNSVPNLLSKGLGIFTGSNKKPDLSTNPLSSDQNMINKSKNYNNGKTNYESTNKSNLLENKKNKEYISTTQPSNVQKTTTKSSTKDEETTPKTYATTTEIPFLTSAKPSEKYDTTTQPSNVQKTTTKSSTKDEKTTPKTYTSTTEKPFITSAKPTEKYDTTTKPPSVQKTTTKSSTENKKTTPKTYTSTTEKPSITSAKPTEKYDITTKHPMEKTTMATPKEITTKNPNQNFVPTQRTERHNQFSRKSKEIDVKRGMKKNLLSSSFLAFNFDWLYYIYIIALIIIVIFIILCLLRYINLRKICCKKKKKKKRKQTCEIIYEEV